MSKLFIKLFIIINQNKKPLVLILVLGLFLSLVPLHSAQAFFLTDWAVDFFGSSIGEAMMNFGAALFLGGLAFLTGLVVLAAGIIQGIISSIVMWLIDVTIAVPIIHSHIVEDVGWPFVRDFANMFFILILVFIGLATILKLGDYGAKKALPRLIIIAILLNFSLVIVGFIVDISNIISAGFFYGAKEIGGIGNLGDMVSSGFKYFGKIYDIFLSSFGFGADTIALENMTNYLYPWLL